MVSVFSKRHKKGIENKDIVVSIPGVVRNRLWLLLLEHDDIVYVSHYTSSDWKEESTILNELPNKLEAVYGEKIKGYVWDESLGNTRRQNVTLEGLIKSGCPPHVWDSIELFYLDIAPDAQIVFQKASNQILEEEDQPWRFVNGEFFAIESEFLTERILERVFELMKAKGFEGPLDEFRKAMDLLTAGDYKNAIHNASNSFESTIKIVLNTDKGTAKDLINGLKTSGFYYAVPEDVIKSFGDNVLYGLPFLRNKLGGHGQGEEVLKIPKVYAELAINLAGSFIIFIIQNHINKDVRNESTEIDVDF